MSTHPTLPKIHWQATAGVATCAMLFSSLLSFASPPVWWSERGVIKEGAEEDNFGAVNLGQAKWMTTQAYAELSKNLAPFGGVDFALDDVFPEPPIDPSAEWFEQQKVPLNIGQLKALAQPFYDNLNRVSPGFLAHQASINEIPWIEGKVYPWEENTPIEQNYGTANIGQLKSTFAFRFDHDSDEDSLSDFWEFALTANPEFSQFSEGLEALSGVGNADGDAFTDREEFLLGTNPFVFDGAPVVSIDWTRNHNVVLSHDTSGSRVERDRGDDVWDASASTALVMGGDGSFNFEFLEEAVYTMAGFSYGDTTYGNEDYGYCFFLTDDGLYVREGTRNIFKYDSYTSGDRLSIRRSGIQIKYFVNDELVYTSQDFVLRPLFAQVTCGRKTSGIQAAEIVGFTDLDKDRDAMVDDWELAQIVNANLTDGITSIEHVDPLGDFDRDGISNVVEHLIESDPVNTPHQGWLELEWTDFHNTEETNTSDQFGSTLTKITGGNSYNADANSALPILGDGGISFRVGNYGDRQLCGLQIESDNTDLQTLRDIDFGIFLAPDGSYHVYEIGEDKGIYGQYGPGDSFSIERDGKTILYKKNGVIFYQSSQTTLEPLIADCSIHNRGSSLKNVLIRGVSHSGDLDGDKISYNDEYAILSKIDRSRATSIADITAEGDLDDDGIANLEELQNGNDPTSIYSGGGNVVWPAEALVAWYRTDGANTVIENGSGGLSEWRNTLADEYHITPNRTEASLIPQITLGSQGELHRIHSDEDDVTNTGNRGTDILTPDQGGFTILAAFTPTEDPLSVQHGIFNNESHLRTGFRFGVATGERIHWWSTQSGGSLNLRSRDPVVYGDYHQMSLSYDPDELSTLRFNGELQSSVKGGVIHSNTNPINLNLIEGEIGQPTDWHELLITHRALTYGEQTLLEDYLAAKHQNEGPLAGDLNTNGIVDWQEVESGETRILEEVLVDTDGDGGTDKIEMIIGTPIDVPNNYLVGTRNDDDLDTTSLSSEPLYVIGRAGDDKLTGDAGSQVYFWQWGDGNDYIYDYSDDVEKNTIFFGEGINLEDITAERIELIFTEEGTEFLPSALGDSLRLFIDHPNRPELSGSILIEEYYYFIPEDWQFKFSNGQLIEGGLFGTGGNDNLRGTSENDVIRGGAGNDTLRGNGGDDTYIWNLGDGNDFLDDRDELQILELGEGITPSMLSAARYSLGSERFDDDILRDNFGRDAIVFITHPENPELSGRVAIRNGRSKTVRFVFTAVDPTTNTPYATIEANPIRGIFPRPSRKEDRIPDVGGEVFRSALFYYTGERIQLNGTGDSFYNQSENNPWVRDALHPIDPAKRARLAFNIGLYGGNSAVAPHTRSLREDREMDGIPRVEEDPEMGNVIRIQEGGGLLTPLNDTHNAQLNGRFTVSADVKFMELENIGRTSNTTERAERSIFNIRGRRDINPVGLSYQIESNQFRCKIHRENQPGASPSVTRTWNCPYPREFMLNQWHHITCLVNEEASNTVVTLYLNGESLGTQSFGLSRVNLNYVHPNNNFFKANWSGLVFGGSERFLSMGATINPDNGTRWWDDRPGQLDGDIDNMAFWGRFLRGPEIRDVYLSSRVGLDTDNDGIDDADEFSNGLDKFDASDAFSDPDGDGVPSIYELRNGTDPTQPNAIVPNFIVDPVNGTLEGEAGVFQTINAAINAAPLIGSEENPYTIILVKPGVYDEGVRIPEDRRIALIAESGTGETVIHKRALGPCLDLEGEDSYIRGFVLLKESIFDEDLIHVNMPNASSLCTLSHCIIRSSDAALYSLLDHEGGHLLLDHVTVFHRNVNNVEHVIELRGSRSKPAELTLRNSIVWSVQPDGHTINLNNSSNNSIQVTNSWVKHGEHGGHASDPLIDVLGYIYSPNSPVINAATGSSSVIDIDGEDRVDTPDVGADEWRGELDVDGDSLTALEEFQAGSNPRVVDDLSVNHDDGDGDGLSDLAETSGVAIIEGESIPIIGGSSDPSHVDSDGDLFDDFWEVLHGYNPRDASDPDADTDADNDGLSNFHEFLIGSDPRDSDTDGDGGVDQIEMLLGTPIDLPNNYLVGTKEDDQLEAGSFSSEMLFVVGGAGDDQLRGRARSQIYFWQWGDGNDYIDSSSNRNRLNTVFFGEGISLEDIVTEPVETVEVSDEIQFHSSNTGSSLRLLVTHPDVPELSGSVVVENYYNSQDGWRLVFADGHAIEARLLTTNGSDELEGDDSNNVIKGGAGNDTLRGNGGDDTYIWNLGDGNDFLDDRDELQILELGEGITPSMLSAARYSLGSERFDDDILRDNFGRDAIVFITHPENPELSGRVAIRNGRSKTVRFVFTAVDPTTNTPYATIEANPIRGIFPRPSRKEDRIPDVGGEVFRSALFYYTGERIQLDGTGDSFYNQSGDNPWVRDALHPINPAKRARLAFNIGLYGGPSEVGPHIRTQREERARSRVVRGFPRVEEDPEMGNVIRIQEGGGVLTPLNDTHNAQLNGRFTVSADVKFMELENIGRTSNTTERAERSIFNIRGRRDINPVGLSYQIESNQFRCKIHRENQPGASPSVTRTWNCPYPREFMLNQWHHITCLVNEEASNTVVTLYLNGESLGTQSFGLSRVNLNYVHPNNNFFKANWSGLVFGGSERFLSMGATINPDNGTRWWDDRPGQLDGDIDNMAFWGRFLSGAEIRDVYLSSRGGLDSDNDGVDDLDELTYGLDPIDTSDALSDLDGDGIPFVYELRNGMDPAQPNAVVPNFIVDPVNGTARGESGVFQTINAAINAAPLVGSEENPYTIILVKPGVYDEGVRIPANRRIALIAESGSGETVIHKRTSGPSLDVIGESSYIRGFVFSKDGVFGGNVVHVRMLNTLDVCKMTNCIIRASSVARNTLIDHDSGRLALDHVTVFHENVNNTEPLIELDGSITRQARLTLRNSIVWSTQTSGEIIKLNDLQSLLTYNLIGVANSWVKDGEHGGLATDPLIDRLGYINSPNSPAINAAIGSPSGSDIDGEDRIDTPDVGADEWRGELDVDGDGLSALEEFQTGGSIHGVSFSGDGNIDSADSDRDGLSNSEEISGVAVINGVSIPIIGGSSDPINFDSDGNLFDDFWEVQHGYNPRDASDPDADADEDNDGLSNFEEFLAGTNPRSIDSDGDGSLDRDEIEFGSDPNLSTDSVLDITQFFGASNTDPNCKPIGNLGFNLTGNNDPSGVVVAKVGDFSSSKSERWSLKIGPRQLVSKEFGVVTEPTDIRLDPTKNHKVTLQHVATDPKFLERTEGVGCYDYRALIDTSDSGFIICDVDELFQERFFGGTDPSVLDEIHDKEAYLIPLSSMSFSESFSGNDAVGPRHRKVSLNGRPLSDEQPQQEEETDLPEEQTYVDAFNRSLHHDNSIIYTPLASSDLKLQVSMSTAETGFSNRSGLRPNERLDLPFGPGWSSNLCSYIEIAETMGDDSDDPISVSVIDEAGRSLRFGTFDGNTFFPWPSSRVDKKTYLNSLERVGGTFVLKKKFGNTLTYEASNAWFLYSSDRVSGGRTVRRHNYWRLKEVRDRYGVSLQYNYGGNPTSLLPVEISSPERPGQAIGLTLSTNCRRVTSVTDSRGNVTRFNYTDNTSYNSSPAEEGDVPISIIAPVLTSVDFPDSSRSQYTYETVIDVESDEDRSTTYFHSNIKSITDKRGNTHTFHYGFDYSQEALQSQSSSGSFPVDDLDGLPPEVIECIEEHADSDSSSSDDFRVVFGRPRVITSVDLPGGIGSSQFAYRGRMRFGPQVDFIPPVTTVTDSLGNQTIYSFHNMVAELVDVDATSDSTSVEWLVYYLTSRIDHGGARGRAGYLGSESYTYDLASGLSLSNSTDFSGNTNSWDYGDSFEGDSSGVIRAFLPDGSSTFSTWSDPTSMTDGLGRTTSYEYSEFFRVMSSTNDVYGSETTNNVDSLGRRLSYSVRGKDSTEDLYRKRFTYSDQFSAFLTSETTEAFTSVSNQSWEQNLSTNYEADNLGRVAREIVSPEDLNLITLSSYDLNNNRTGSQDPRGNITEFEYDTLNRLTRVIYPEASTSDGPRQAVKEIWYDQNGNKAAEIDEEGNFTIRHYDELNRLVTSIRDMDGSGLPSLSGGLVTTNRGSVTGSDLVTNYRYDAVNSITHVIDPNGNLTRTFYDLLRRPTHVFTGLNSSSHGSSDLESLRSEARGSTEITHTEFSYGTGALILPSGRSFASPNTGASGFNSSGFKPTRIVHHDAVLTDSGTKSLTTWNVYDATYRLIHTEQEFISVDWQPAAGGESTAASSPRNTSGFKASSVTYGGAARAAGGKEELFTTAIDARGKRTRTIMDALQRTTEIVDDLGGLNATTRNFYSSTGLLWKVQDPERRETECEYDRAGRKTHQWAPDPDSGVVDRSSPGNPTLGSPLTRTIYDGNSNVVATINPLGNRWDYIFDARNRAISEQQPAVVRAEVVDTQIVRSGPLRPRTLNILDGVGNSIVATDARGHQVRSFYDKAYRITDTVTNSISGQPSEDRASLGLGDIRTSMSYDGNSNVITTTDGNGNITQNTYDRQNRLISTATNPATGQPSSTDTPHADDIVVRNSYDDIGNLVQVKDGDGHITGFRYDGLSRKTRTIWDEGSTTQRVQQCAYDALVKTHRVDSKGRETHYTYDRLHRLKNTIYRRSTIPERTALSGAQVSSSPGATPYQDDRTYRYDLVNNLLSVEYPNETPQGRQNRRVFHTYDHLNRVIEEESAGARHDYTYDKAGNRLTTTFGNTGRHLTSSYDRLNRLTSLLERESASAPSGGLTQYSYDLNGNITQKRLPNGTLTECRYDALNRKLSKDSLSGTGSTIVRFDYTTPHPAHSEYPTGYDNVGNVLRIAETYGSATMEDRVVENTYDHSYRLGRESLATDSEKILTTYSYDKTNNRLTKLTEKTTAGASTSVTTENWISVYGNGSDGWNSNQLKSATESVSNRVITYDYDANGNRIRRLENDEVTHEYFDDFENRYTHVDDYSEDQLNVSSGNNTSHALSSTTYGSYEYKYDHRTRRTYREENVAGGEAEFVSFSGGTSAQEYRVGRSTPTVEYIRGSDYGGGIGGVLYTIRSGQPTYNYYNSRGDVVSQTTDLGDISWQASYEAFGTRTKEEGENEERQKANTKDEDGWGVLNEGFRYRDLETGVWLTRDPLGFVDGPNEYTYVRQNPWTFFDPLGLYEMKNKGHHKVPKSVVRDSGWGDEAKKLFDSSDSIIDTPKGHNYTAHAKYNNEVKAELDEFFKEKNIKNVSGKTAREQKKLAGEFIERISNTNNEYIKGFNNAVPGGAEAVKKWNLTEGQFIKLKSTGKVAHLGGKIIKGLKRAPGAKYAVSIGVYNMSVRNSLGQGDPKWKAHTKAALDTASPVGGPGDTTATWSMNHSQMVESNVDHPFDMVNPFSPRFLPTQVTRSLYGPLLGTEYMKDK